MLGIHTNALGFVTELPAIHRGRPMRRDKVIDVIAREALFEPLIEAGELEYIIDGDTYTCSGPLRLATGPRLTFLRLTGNVTDEKSLAELEAAAGGALPEIGPA
jgi:hypothetical protein